MANPAFLKNSFNLYDFVLHRGVTFPGVDLAPEGILRGLQAGNDIVLTELPNNNIEIASTGAASAAEAIYEDANTYFVSNTHPDLGNGKVFGTVGAVIPLIVTGPARIMVSPNTYNESYTTPNNILIEMNNATQIGTITLGAGCIIKGDGGLGDILTVTSSNQVTIDGDFVINSITGTIGTTASVFHSTIGSITGGLGTIELVDCIVTGAVNCSTLIATNCIFSGNITASTECILRNCSTDLTTGVLTSSSINLDGTSKYEFETNSWTLSTVPLLNNISRLVGYGNALTGQRTEYNSVDTRTYNANNELVKIVSRQFVLIAGGSTIAYNISPGFSYFANGNYYQYTFLILISVNSLNKASCYNFNKGLLTDGSGTVISQADQNTNVIQSDLTIRVVIGSPPHYSVPISFSWNPLSPTVSIVNDVGTGDIVNGYIDTVITISSVS